MNIQEREDLKHKRALLCDELHRANFSVGAAIFGREGEESIGRANKCVEELAQQLREMDARLESQS